jgi:hypothetical protein
MGTARPRLSVDGKWRFRSHLLAAARAPGKTEGLTLGSSCSAQREFEGRLRMAGGVYVLARSLEDVERVLAKLSMESKPKMAA